MAIAEFVLGFRALADLLLGILGPLVPLENERFNPESGDSLQAVRMPDGTVGLMVWRKVDNWTAFTDGHRTWVNGPLGLQERLNSERFQWEMDYQEQLPAPLIEHWDSPNCWPGRPYGPPIAIVIHTMAGSESGMEAVAMSPAAQVSAHFGCNLDGDLDQFVPLESRAWANGILEQGHRWYEVYQGPKDGFCENPNNHTVSVETEDRGSAATPVTDALYLATHAACRLALATYPSIGWLLRHADISPRSRSGCPGPRWVQSGRFVQLAQDLGLKALL